MSSYLELMKFADSPAPTKEDAAPQSATSGSSASYSKLAPLAPPPSTETPSNGLGPEGSSPNNPIPESPLGFMDRGRLGWEKTPAAQQKFLAEMFGPDNVQLLNKGSSAEFVVKKDGAWRQVNPNFEWSFSGKGAAIGAATGFAVGNVPGMLAGAAIGGISPSIANTKNLKDLPGDVAESVGEYGLKMAAAGRGAAMGGTAAGPIGAIVGAGLGAVAEDGIETAGRYALSKMGASRPESLPQNADDTVKQLFSSFLFGATQELGSKALSAGASGTVKLLSNAIEAMGVTPTGKTIAAKMLSTIGGTPEWMARWRVEDPKAMVPFDYMARKDALNGPGSNEVAKGMQNLVSSWEDTATTALRQVGKKYDAIEKAAGTLDYIGDSSSTSLTGAAQNLLKQLADFGYTKNGGVVDYTKTGGVARKLSDASAGAVDYVVTQANRILGQAKGGKLGYQDLRGVIGSLDNILADGGKELGDANLNRLLTEARVGLKQHMIAVLHDSNPALGKAFTDLNSTYGPIKELMDTLAKKTGPEKVDTLIKKLIKDDGSFNAEIATNISKALGVNDPTPSLIRAHIAQNSTGFWGGNKLFGAVPYGSQRAGTAIADVGSDAIGAVQQMRDAIPYLNQGLKFVKEVGSANRKRLYQNEEALSQMSQIMSGASVGEKQLKQGLLEGAAVIPPKGPAQ